MSFKKVSETESTSNFEPPWFYAAEESNLTEGKLLRAEPGGRNVLLIKVDMLRLSQTSVLMRSALWIKEGLRSLF